jgi:cytochrome c2
LQLGILVGGRHDRSFRFQENDARPEVAPALPVGASGNAERVAPAGADDWTIRSIAADIGECNGSNGTAAGGAALRLARVRILRCPATLGLPWVECSCGDHRSGLAAEDGRWKDGVEMRRCLPEFTPMRLPLLLAVLTLSTQLPGSAEAADIAHGKELFQKCMTCHSNDPAKADVGPPLNGVYGRKAAALDSFRYSAAMRRSRLTWDDATLESYLADPAGFVKGNRMPYAGLPTKAERDDVIAYLKTLN